MIFFIIRYFANYIVIGALIGIALMMFFPDIFNQMYVSIMDWFIQTFVPDSLGGYL